MNRAHRAERNIAIRSRRAKGALIKTIAIEFGMSADSIHEICAGVSKPALRLSEQAAVADKRKAIALDAGTLAEIAAALREKDYTPHYQYKSTLSWPS